MTRKLTTEEFIVKAKAIHGDKYNYSLTEYINGDTKVQIICPEHGLFEQIPQRHLSGNGCCACGRESMKQKRKKTQETFLAEARSIHDNKYDYSETEYLGTSLKIKIICKKHMDHFIN